MEVHQFYPVSEDALLWFLMALHWSSRVTHYSSAQDRNSWFSKQQRSIAFPPIILTADDGLKCLIVKLFWHNLLASKGHRHKQPAKSISSRAFTDGGNASGGCYTEYGQRIKHTLFNQGIFKVSSGDLLELSGRDFKVLPRNPKAHLFLKRSYSIYYEVQTNLAQCRNL